MYGLDPFLKLSPRNLDPFGYCRFVKKKETYSELVHLQFCFFSKVYTYNTLAQPGPLHSEKELQFL